MGSASEVWGVMYGVKEVNLWGETKSSAKRSGLVCRFYTNWFLYQKSIHSLKWCLFSEVWINSYQLNQTHLFLFKHCFQKQYDQGSNAYFCELLHWTFRGDIFRFWFRAWVPIRVKICRCSVIVYSCFELPLQLLASGWAYSHIPYPSPTLKPPLKITTTVNHH